jgi:hypothetical protein
MMPDLDCPAEQLERQVLDLTVVLAECYKGLVNQWLLGDKVIQWTVQCETTFRSDAALRGLLPPDVWPHAARASFVTLLREKAVPTNGLDLESSVGLRLTYRQPPPAKLLSPEFLACFEGKVAGSTYRAWANQPSSRQFLLPPDRFHFQVIDLGA